MFTDRQCVDFCLNQDISHSTKSLNSTTEKLQHSKKPLENKLFIEESNDIAECVYLP